MEINELFVLLSTVFNWIKKVIAALGLADNEQIAALLGNIDNALGIIDTEPNTST